MDNIYEIQVGDYDVTCQVTYYFKQEPNSKADNPEDYHGYTEIEFDILSVTEWDNDLDIMIESNVNLDDKDSEIKNKLIPAHEENLNDYFDGMEEDYFYEDFNY